MAIRFEQLPAKIKEYNRLFIGTGGRKKYREIILETATQLQVTFTPIDTGLAKNNWFIQAGSPDLVSKNDKLSGSTVKNTISVNNIKSVEEDVYISNNLEYIEALENNHSPQTIGLGILKPASEFFLLTVRKEYLKAFR